MFSLPLIDPAFDLATIVFISALIVLSVFSLCFIFHLRFKSKSLLHLQGFNSLWTVRFLLVLFIIFWAIIELLRLPLYRRRYLQPFSSSIAYQVNLCKIHTLLSLGFLEPAFLVTLLFLLNASITKKTPKDTWAISSVLLTCLPLTVLHALLISLEPLRDRLPAFFYQTSVVLRGDSGSGRGTDLVLCAYPLANGVVFAAFGVAYALWFLCSCWRVLSLVINKGLRVRICGLATAVLVGLPLQIVSLALSAFCDPAGKAYGVAVLVVFLGAFCCAAVGEGILVIKPISDALDTGERCFRPNCCGGGWSRRSSESEMMGVPAVEEGTV